MLNRIYLVAAGVLSLSIPFIRLDWITQQEAAKKVYTTVNWDSILQQATIVTDDDTGLNLANAFVMIYCAGILFFVGRLIFNLLAVNNLISSAKSGSAFSFFSKKVIDRNLPLSDVIDVHEETHIKQWHTLDILFFELLGILNWLNPVIYFYKKSIKNIHEFLADQHAAEYQGDKAEYAMLILSQSFGISPNSLTNGFFDQSLIKKRIFMLQKEKSKKAAIIKYGIFIPLFALLIIFSSATVRKNRKLVALSDQIPLEKPLEMVEEMVTPGKESITTATENSVESETEKADGALKNKRTDLPTQTKPDANTEETIDLNASEDQQKDKVFDFVSIDKQPEFPGGINEFYRYLGKSIKYPKEAIDNNVSGKVFLSFIVEKNGELSDVQITRALGSGTDEEAVRVIKNSPKWNPGIANDKPVRVKYNINVNFNLAIPVEKPLTITEAKTNTQVSKIPLSIGNSKDNLKNFNGLWVVDGIKTDDHKALSTMNQNEIESINVLKGNAATSIYGVQAKEGAILITTKKGKKSTFRKPNQTHHR